MGSNSASGGSGGGRTDAGPKRTTATKIGVGNINEKGKLTGQYRSDNPSAFRNRGAEDIKKKAKKFPTPTLVLASKPLQAGSKVTRDFFTDKVLGSKNYKNVSKTEFLSYDTDKQEMMYDKYISGRTSGRTDAYGNPINNRDDRGGNQVVQAPTEATMTAPTTAEVSQSSATDATDAATVDTDDPTYIKRKTKRQGRSLTILTSSKGTSDGLTLGKRSLLGS